jgi:hypothetical protein
MKEMGLGVRPMNVKLITALDCIKGNGTLNFMHKPNTREQCRLNLKEQEVLRNLRGGDTYRISSKAIY